jgi:hypothetical protein
MIGIIYIKLNLSLFRPRFKIGVARLGRRNRRWKEIQRSTPGLQVPAFFVVVLFPYTVERALHILFASDRAPLRYGSGKTEWFRFGLLGVNFLTVIGFMCAVWVGWGMILFALLK